MIGIASPIRCTFLHVRLRQLANEGRRPVAVPAGPVRTNASHNLVDTRWDGSERRMVVLPVSVAAAALGLTAATVTLGTA